MGDFLDLLTGSLGGSLVGAIGAAFNKWHETKTKLKLKELEIERDKMLNAHELQVMQSESEAATKQLEYKALGTSMESDRATYATDSDSGWLVFVDVVRGLVRPTLTATLLVYCMIMLLYLTNHYTVEFTDEQVYDLVHMIVHNLVVCSGVALTWWFGSRSSSKSLKLG